MNSENIKGSSISGRIATGAIFIVAGIILLTETMNLGINIPDWVISWPVLLILFGVLSGIRHNFRRAGAYFMLAIGIAFLAERIVPDIHSHQLIFPGVILATGLYMIFGRKVINLK